MRLRGIYDVYSDEDRINLIANLVEEGSQDPDIRELAIKILHSKGVKEKDEIGEIKAIFEWVKKNIRYTKDVVGRDTYHTAKRILELKAGDCIPLTQRLIVRNKKTGMYEIVEAGDLKDCYNKYEALSYNFLEQKWEFKDILNWVYKKKKPIVSIRLNNGTTFEVTPNHDLYVLDGQINHKNNLKLKLRNVEQLEFIRKNWQNRNTLSSKMRLLSAFKIPSLGKTYDENKLWIYGIYVAEGWTSDGKVCIANDDENVRKIIMEKLEKLSVKYTPSKRTKHAYVNIRSNELKTELKRMGEKSINKKFPKFVLSLTEDNIETLLEGYTIGDAYKPKKESKWYKRVRRVYNTISEELAKQLFYLHLVLGKPLYVQYQPNHMGAGKNPIWRLYEYKNGQKWSYKEILPYLKASYIFDMKYNGIKETCDITVKDNHNFVLDNGILVKNCDDFVILLNSLLASIGYPVGARIVSTSPDRPFHHIYSLVYSKKKGWIALDASEKKNKIGEEPKYAKKKDFIFIFE